MARGAGSGRDKGKRRAERLLVPRAVVRRALVPYEAAAGFFNRRAALAAFCLALVMGLAASGIGVAGGVKPLRVLFLGDSIAAGYGLPEAASLPVRLEAALRQAGHDVRIVNGGVSGDTTAGGLARLDWMLADKPDRVILELSANDALRGTDPAEAYANLDKILTRLDGLGIKTLLLGMKAPRNLGTDYDREFDAIYPRLAAKHKIALYPFLLEDVAVDPKLNQGDGLHPNEAGVAIIVGHILPLVEALVKE
jgi:acyl-CoA thioesterase-1